MWGIGHLWRWQPGLWECLSRLQAVCLGPEGRVGSQFGLLQLEGTWYVKAMVTTKNLTERKVPWEAFPVTLTALEGGKFEVTNTIM
jgi:hypothetical protein